MLRSEKHSSAGTLSAVTIEDGGIALSDNYLKIELDSTREPNRLIDVAIGGIGAHGVCASAHSSPFSA